MRLYDADGLGAFQTRRTDTDGQVYMYGIVVITVSGKQSHRHLPVWQCNTVGITQQLLYTVTMQGL